MLFGAVAMLAFVALGGRPCLQTCAVQPFGRHHGAKVDRSVDVGERFRRAGQSFVDQRRRQELLVDLQQDEI